MITVHLNGSTKVESYWNDVIDTGIVNVVEVAPKGQPSVNQLSLFVRRGRPGLVDVVDSIIEGLGTLRLRLLVDCLACQGSGTWEEHDVGCDGEEITVYTPCPECMGQGKVAPCRLPDEATSA